MNPRWLTPQQWLRAAASGMALERHHPLASEPWLLLDLRQTTTADDGLRERLLEQPCPVIGLVAADEALPELAPVMDCLVEAGDLGLQSVLANIRRAPVAAMTLVQLARATETMPLLSALDMESLAYATLQGGAEYGRWLRARDRPQHQQVDIPTPVGPPVLLQRTGSKLELRLNRPANRNAISVEIRDALVEAFELVALDDSIAEVVLSGEGRCFSVGGDLQEFGAVPDTATGHLVRSLRLPARGLARCASRCTAVVHGACIGAGVELPAFAGRVVAHSRTHFQLPEITMGLVPGAGGCVSIPRRIGRQRFVWMALSARRINVRTALEWGLVDEIEA